MKFSVNRENLLRPLQQVAGVVERRHTLPVLSNILLRANADHLSMTGTDLEVELTSRVSLEVLESGEITIPARKFMDICRELPDQAHINFEVIDQRLSIKSGRFRSTLSTLPAKGFPGVEKSDVQTSFQLTSEVFRCLIDRTSFAMAQKDVRYFLNGMLVELGEGQVRTVATDGHRLAISSFSIHSEIPTQKVIVPRKGILEIQRLLNEIQGEAMISLSDNHIAIESADFLLTSKLVDGRFPDYDRVVPKNGDKIVLVDREELRAALNRTAILSNEKYRGIRINLSSGLMQLSTNNPEQEEAEEFVNVDYEGENLEMGFNVAYLQDVLSVLEGDKVKLVFHDANSSVVLEEVDDSENSIYVVMPMKL